MNGKWEATTLAGTLALAVLALTPIAGSTRGVFATNSERIDGLQASSKAKAGMLLSPGTNRSFPRPWSSYRLVRRARRAIPGCRGRRATRERKAPRATREHKARAGFASRAPRGADAPGDDRL